MSDIELIYSCGDARVDSRLIAINLCVKHKNTFALIEKHQAYFQRFGLLPFETESVKEVGARGVKHHRYAALNEDQAYFLLSLTKNTRRVVELKANLVLAFRDARNKRGLDGVMGMILLKAPAPWEKRFGDDYYQALAKVTGTIYSGHAKGTPYLFGQMTDKWIYAAILPQEVHAELKARRGDSERMHQWLTDGGRDRLDQQIRMVTIIANSSVDRKDFEARCMQAFGIPGQLRLIYPGEAA